MSAESDKDQAVQEGKRLLPVRTIPVIAVPIVLIVLLLRFFSVTSAFQVTTGADLAVSKTVNNPVPAAGDMITYTLVVVNNGPEAATNVSLTDLLPAGLTFVSTDPFTAAYTSTTGLWEIGSLEVMSSATLRLGATIDQGASGSIINTALDLTSDQDDPEPANNSSSVVIAIQTAAATSTVTGTPPTATITGTPPTATITGTLPTATVSGTPPTATATGTQPTETRTPTPTVTGTPPTATPTVTGTPPTPTRTGTITPSMNITNAVSPNQARAGQNLTFTIRVNNNGSAPASEVEVTTSYSTMLDITNATTTKGQATTNTSNRRVTVDIGTVNPGETVTITITTRVNSSATTTTNLTNSATMTFEDNAGNPRTQTSNTVTFQIVGGTALPGTGWGPPIDDGSGGRLRLQKDLVQAALSAGPERQPPAAPPALSSPAQSDASPETGRPVPLLSLLFLLAGLAALSLGLLLKTLRREKILFIGVGVWLLLLAVILSPVTVSWLRPAPQAAGLAPTPLPTQPAAFATGEPEAIQIIWPTPVIVETLPDYPIPTPDITPTSGEAGEALDTSPIQQILIPALGVDTVVKYVPFDGLTWLISGLQQEVAWLGETSWPGLGGNTALAGHVTLRNGGNGPFRYLESLVPGDAIVLLTKQRVYTYRVKELKVVTPLELSVLEQTGDQRLTLITCTGWDVNVGMYQERLIVTAELDGVEARQVAGR